MTSRPHPDDGTPHRPHDTPIEDRLASTQPYLRERETTLHAFVDRHAEPSLRARARAMDALPTGERGALHGTTLAIKEVIDVAGLRCTLGSPCYRERVPQYNAALVDRLQAAGGVVLGTAASTEFAIAAAPPTTNPHDATRSPGGSSSGPAAAVGAGLVDLAIGTQTIGSIIRPAAYCGVAGFKPSYGRIPVDRGIMALAPSLDHVGLLAADLDLFERALYVLAPAAPLGAGELAGLCTVAPWFDRPLAAPVVEALVIARERLAAQGLACRASSLPASAADENSVATDILLYEMKQSIAPRVSSPTCKISDKLRDMLKTARAVDTARYQKARARQSEIADDLHRMLRPGEVLLAPATLDIAPKRTAGTGPREPQRLWSLAGMPALTLPVTRHAGLPVGIQLVGRRGDDATVLAAGRLLCRSAG